MKNKRGSVLAALAMGAAVSAFAAAANATITLDYQGNPFTSTPHPELGVNGVTATVTLDVPADYSGVVQAASFESWQLSTSAVTLSSSDPDDILAAASIHLDGSGGVTSFSIEGLGDLAGNPFIAISSGEDAVGPSAADFPDSNQVNGNPGVWTVAAGVPEPATWAMMMLGFGAVGAVVRRRPAALSI